MVVLPLNALIWSETKFRHMLDGPK